MGGLTLGQEDFLIVKSLMGIHRFEVEIRPIFQFLARQFFSEGISLFFRVSDRFNFRRSANRGSLVSVAVAFC